MRLGTPQVFDERDLLPLSGLQHLVFCERQCALIHVEQIWEENDLTTSGAILHRKVDSVGAEARKDLRVVRSVRVRSLALGLTGRIDALELRRDGSEGATGTPVRVPGLKGRWRLMPVEYKRGRPKDNDCDRVQLCAQALCLEEMTGAFIPDARMYYGSPRRRFEVTLDDPLRDRTRCWARRFHELIRSGLTPPAVEEPKCKNCSLKQRCLPPKGNRSVRAYVDRESMREC